MPELLEKLHNLRDISQEIIKDEGELSQQSNNVSVCQADMIDLRTSAKFPDGCKTVPNETAYPLKSQAVIWYGKYPKTSACAGKFFAHNWSEIQHLQPGKSRVMVTSRTIGIKVNVSPLL